MSDEIIVCIGCGYKFTFEESERQWLLKQVEDGILPSFSTPKRCKECRRKRQQAARAPLSVPVKPAAPLGTDQCGCVVAPNAPYPACPHDVSGAPGAPGQPGILSRIVIPSVKFAAVPKADPEKTMPPVPPKPVLPPAPAEVAVVPPSEPRPYLPLREEDIRVILLSDDYEKLICREEIVWKQGSKKVRIILADIGFPAMKAALERAMMKWLKS